MYEPRREKRGTWYILIQSDERGITSAIFWSSWNGTSYDTLLEDKIDNMSMLCTHGLLLS